MLKEKLKKNSIMSSSESKKLKNVFIKNINKSFEKRVEKKIKKKNLFKLNRYFLNKKVKILNNLADFNSEIIIKLTPNNVFCTLIQKFYKKTQTIAVHSAGISKLNVSKKKLKFFSFAIIKLFIKSVKKRLPSSFLITLKCFRKQKRKTIKFLKRIIFKKNVIFQVKALKCFNGCRPKKKKRKKQKGLRLFKL